MLRKRELGWAYFFVMMCLDANDTPVWLEVLKCCLSDSMFKLLGERVTILECKFWFLMMNRLLKTRSRIMSYC